MHHVAYRQEPARRPMMAIMNPSHVAAQRTPREPAGPRPKKRTPRAANVNCRPPTAVHAFREDVRADESVE